MDDVIFGLESPAKARAEIANPAIAFDQGLRARGPAWGTDSVMAPRCLGHEGLGRFQNKSAFLREFFLPRFDHLIMRGLLDPIGHELLAQVLVIFDPRGAMPGG